MVNEKYHYYTTNFRDSNYNEVRFKGLKWDYKIRDEAMYFQTHFQPVQIFKADLLKQHYMHLLKCGEVDFYET